jgi:hypothetical protein
MHAISGTQLQLQRVLIKSSAGHLLLQLFVILLGDERDFLTGRTTTHKSQGKQKEKRRKP